MSRIACPYCCEIQTFTGSEVCRRCGTSVPVKFIKAGREVSPIYLAAIGMSQVGKTTYIDSLTMSMLHLDKIADAYIDPLDDFTYTQVRKIRGQVETQTKAAGTTPKSNKTETLNPLVLSLRGFVSSVNRTLVIYDLAGESFKKREEIADYADPIKLADTIWFFVSLFDLEHDTKDYFTLPDLLNIYLAGMERAGGNPQGRSLHVIYTKADKLNNILPVDIRDYLRTDPYTNLADKKPSELRDKQFDQRHYMADLDTRSHQLADFTTDEVQRGKAFITMVKDAGMRLSFSITSSIGRDTLRDNSTTRYQSFRVLDPLIWALRDGIGPDNVPQRPAEEKEIVLILDCGYGSEAIYKQDLHTLFFHELMPLGMVKTFFMGSVDPMANPGRAPQVGETRRYTPAFIGPILDQLRPDALVVVITRQDIIDLDDFRGTDWEQRMGLVTYKPTDRWPKVQVFARDLDLAPQTKTIIKRFFTESL